MKSGNDQPKKVALADLFALKRTERPPEEFWSKFQRELHVRQRAAAIEPKRWWFVLPRVFAGFSRYHMPIGAAAVLAVTFLSFREYREPGFGVAYTAPLATATAESEITLPAMEVQAEFTPLEVALADLAVEEEPVADRVTPPVNHSFELSPMVGWAGPALTAADVWPTAPTPSQRSIAANLAAVEQAQVSTGMLLDGSRLDLAAAIAQTESLSQITVPEPTREHLFVYQASPADFDLERENENGPDTHSRIARRIRHDDLYDSVSRLTAGGDHLTLKF